MRSGNCRAVIVRAKGGAPGGAPFGLERNVPEVARSRRASVRLGPALRCVYGIEGRQQPNQFVRRGEVVT